MKDRTACADASSETADRREPQPDTRVVGRLVADPRDTLGSAETEVGFLGLAAPRDDDLAAEADVLAALELIVVEGSRVDLGVDPPPTSATLEELGAGTEMELVGLLAGGDLSQKPPLAKGEGSGCLPASCPRAWPRVAP